MAGAAPAPVPGPAQDGFALYLHGFVVADDGAWVVVQQGMDVGRRRARRYHWIWDRVGAFVEEPHADIEGTPVGDIVNLTDRRSAVGRAATLVLGQGGPARPIAALERPAMPAHHDVRPEDIDLARLGKTLSAVADRGPQDFAELLLPGHGARTLLALALVAEVVHGAPSRFADPARFSLAHGGKDGHPFPVPTLAPRGGSSSCPSSSFRGRGTARSRTSGRRCWPRTSGPLSSR
jgi:uncharacterized protein